MRTGHFSRVTPASGWLATPAAPLLARIPFDPTMQALVDRGDIAGAAEHSAPRLRRSPVRAAQQARSLAMGSRALEIPVHGVRPADGLRRA